MTMGGLWLWVLGLLSLPVLILGAPSASSCSEACGASFSEGLNPEETQTSWDKDIPAINQGLIPEETPESSFLLEGDILRPSPFRMFSATSNKWPKNGEVVEVPFLLSSKYDKSSRDILLKAFDEFERFTCIRFVAYQGQRDFISIVPMSGCFSSVGRSGGMQVVSLAPTCLQKGPGIVLHELMHVLGFWHEHSRADRDHYIRVNWNEILPGLGDPSDGENGCSGQWGSAAFECGGVGAAGLRQKEQGDCWGEGAQQQVVGEQVSKVERLAFSRRGLPTITPLWAPSAHIGQRWNLSTSDIARVLRLYDCSPSGQSPSGTGFQPHSDGRSPTATSRPYLQQLLKVLLAESGSPDASGSEARGQRVVAGPGESPRRWTLPVLSKLGVEASARLLQTPASSLNSRPGAGIPGIALERSWPAQVPSVPPAASPEAEDQPVPIQGALGSTAPRASCTFGRWQQVTDPGAGLSLTDRCLLLPPPARPLSSHSPAAAGCLQARLPARASERNGRLGCCASSEHRRHAPRRAPGPS
ncbi:astacin-like metalloendopeptidase [Crocuta crocuta]